MPTKISISVTEKGLFIPHFLGGNIAIFGNISKNGCVYGSIFGNVAKMDTLLK